VAAGNVSDGISHGEHGKAEGQRDSGELDAERGEAGSEDGRSASGKDEPESSKKLRQGTFAEGHMRSPSLRIEVGRLPDSVSRAGRLVQSKKNRNLVSRGYEGFLRKAIRIARSQGRC